MVILYLKTTFKYFVVVFEILIDSRSILNARKNKISTIPQVQKIFIYSNIHFHNRGEKSVLLLLELNETA